MTASRSPRSSRSPQPEHLRQAAEDLHMAISLLLRRMRQQFPGDLTASQAAMGRQLEWEGSCSVADLARAANVRHQSMLATVKAAEAAGVVERRPHPSDGRQTLVTLTSHGRQVLRDRWQTGNDYFAQLIEECLTPEEQQKIAEAVALLRRLAQA
ncbi:MarR family winged helix-turn-helix transcriptional regulator [Streptomyces sp. NPDC001262]|uniref:MarR family winged helix-turn-helix transcriptional regulator n=1 Tax=Streptomyces sp. NPDC001262 TaxID=3364552 RepID=UPI0036996DE0